MIVVFDSSGEERALHLRDILLGKGFPCASCDSDTIKEIQPIGIIVTFTDQIDIVRRMPYDDLPVIAYGDGFVNSALHAIRAGTVEEIIDEICEWICQRFEIHSHNSYLGEGAFFYPGVFLSSFQLIVYGTRINLTDNETLIMRCLILSGDCHRSAKQLSEYCTMGNKNENAMRVHISAINKKGEYRLPSPLVVSKHGQGYSFGYIRNPMAD